MIRFLIRDRVRIKIRIRVILTLAFIIGAIVTGANVVHSYGYLLLSGHDLAKYIVCFAFIST